MYYIIIITMHRKGIQCAKGPSEPEAKRNANKPTFVLFLPAEMRCRLRWNAKVAHLFSIHVISVPCRLQLMHADKYNYTNDEFTHFSCWCSDEEQ